MLYNKTNYKPSVTVDCVVFGLDKSADVRVLLIKRAYEPFKNAWAIPGGFIKENETLDAAAQRELEEETGVRDIFIEQLYTFGSLDRDPRGHVISVAYFALINLEEHPTSAATDAQDAQWFKLSEVPELAFDHAQILDMAIKRLDSKVRYQPIGFELLPDKFTLSELQNLYETILGRALNRRNFRSKILKMGILEQLERQKDVPHRPAFLYKFNKEKYEELTKNGFEFAISPPKERHT
ncbi:MULTISPECIES: NrtR DNA-binding winged helix domain-containing protein [unclassified Aureispira]|uniref:NUDIX hydrolase n=1 Tax=unclassified Aureispira TaxID=2649989 RepID=UPI0006982138|nr:MULTISPECIES: NUDIX domain-containing protein [unclassified Aureispira]WMX12502.1 NUDIX domain-containing protein [Aureispira sp. CCB-E]